MYLTILDATGIQDFVFGSNKLTNNIGGSELVELALNTWPQEIIRNTFSGKTNTYPMHSPPLILEGKTQIEQFYSGGGNTVLLFEELSDAQSFIREYSKRLIEEAPGLKVACIHEEVGGPISKTLQDALVLLAKKKASPLPDASLLGLGVTLPCAYTGRPANGFMRDTPLCAEMLNKRSPTILNKSENRFRGIFSSVLNSFTISGGPTGEFAYPKEFDDLGRTHGESSYIGVVHVDGNGMGRRINEVARTYSQKGKEQDSAYMTDMHKLSEDIKAQGIQAVRAALETIHTALSWTKDGHHLSVADTVILAINSQKQSVFPLRLLVYGGDDITFVCDGRIALDLAACTIEAFQNKDKGFYACAGVAIVKSHYPFARAYTLAEDCCKNAKNYLRDTMGTIEASAIDWHITQGGVETDIDKLRESQYQTVNRESLTLRPYVIDGGMAQIPPGHSWTWFRNTIVDPLVDPCGYWAEKRSRLRGLAPLLRTGNDETEKELRKWIAKDVKPLPGDIDSEDQIWSTSGFYGRATPYIDAIELVGMVPHSSKWKQQKS